MYILYTVNSQLSVVFYGTMSHDAALANIDGLIQYMEKEDGRNTL